MSQKHSLPKRIPGWILNLSFPSLNIPILKILFFAVLLFCISTGNLCAETWRIQKELLSPSNYAKLKRKYAEINSPQVLQNLLRDLGSIEPFSKLTAEYEDGIWIIRGEKAKRILKIKFELLTRTFGSELEDLVEPFLGQADSEEIKGKIYTLIKDYLSAKGYPRAEIRLKEVAQEDRKNLYFKIKPGHSCLVRGVTTNFRIPAILNLKIKKGDVCDTKAISNAVQKLQSELRANGFNQAKLDEPVFDFDEKSNSAEVVVRGFLGKKIKYEIIDLDPMFTFYSLFEKDELSKVDPSIVGPEALAADIARRYRARGFDDVQIEPPTIVEKNVDVTYQFRVKPGPRYKLVEVQIQGALALSKKEILEIMQLSNILQTATILNLNLIQEGIEALKSKYRSMGYWDINVGDPRISKNPESSQAKLILIVREGSQRIFEEATIKGNTVFSEKEIKELLQLVQGEPLDQALLDEFEKQLRNKYAGSGYLYSKLKIDFTFEDNKRAKKTNVFIGVEEGTRVRIGELKVIGLKETSERVVTRELRFETGDWYDPELVDTSRRALLGLGIFRKAQIFPTDPNALLTKSEHLDLTIEVLEAKPGNVSFGPGWSIFYGSRFGVESSYNNIGGVGRQVFGRLKVSEDMNQSAIGDKTLLGRSISVGYLEPYLLDLPVNGTVSLTDSARAEEKWVLSTGAEVGLHHKLRRFLEGSTITTFFAQKKNREVSSGEQKLGYLRFIGGDVKSGRIGLRYALERRNDLVWPTSGYLLNSEVSWARFSLGGNLSYFHWNLSNSYYFQVVRNFVLALGFSFASYQDIKRQGNAAHALPVSETMYVGGADTVRGFRERSLGPKVFFDVFDGEEKSEESNNIGGSQSAVYKGELRYQLIENTMAVSTFIDSGNTFFTDTEIQSFNNKEQENREDEREDRNPTRIVDNVNYRFSDLIERPEYIFTKNYVSYGIALNYLTPLGSINLAYGLPWKRCADENSSECIERGKKTKYWLMDGEVHLNVGASF